MDCADAKLRLEPYATGNLASPDREEFEKHIADCGGCRLELDLVRAGVAVINPEEPAAPAGFVRSGDSGFAQGGAAFGASSDLDETSFADVASQLAQERPPAPADFERSGRLSPPADADAPPAAGPPPAEIAPALEIPATVPDEPPPPPLERASGPAAAPPQGIGAQDYSLDALLADAAPVQPSGPPSPSPDPLDQVLPASGPAPEPGAPKATRGIPRLTPMAAPRAPSSWEFEPVEADRVGSPPEGSLFFAEETLARARDTGGRRKGGAVRLALWIAGTGLGVALLVFAGWIAFHNRPSDETARVVAEQYAAPPGQGSGGTPVEGSAAEPASPGTAAPAEPAPEAAPPEETGSGSPNPPQATETSPRPAPEEAPLVSSASTVAPRSPLPEASGTEPPPKAAPPRKRPERATKTPAPRTKPAGGSGGSVAKGTARSGEPGRNAAPAASAPRAETGTPAAPNEPVRAATGAPKVETSPAATTPSTSETEHPGPVEPGSRAAEPGATSSQAPAAPERAPAVGAPTPAGEGASSQPAPAAPEAAKPSGGAAAAPAPSPESPAAAEEAPPAPQRPIDRLHLATVAAEQRGDLRALRSMRDAWKTFIQKSGVGPDRIRAKRELADCLWAVQGITGRRSDQQEALRAYRDYLLNAPAGGADSRTVGRAKQLQDALSESN